ncbi:MAG: hypothetical protein MJ033_00690 [Victivallaceae bacterium]|nr:hypothetical protein [Victivallaceae bacterium]
MLKKLLADFAAPGVEFRGAPFWSLNGKLDGSRMREEIRTFREMGFGGFFFHSRSGMATPYLSEEWFHYVNVAADEAEKCGLQMWIYDEDRWPSGSAGGIVTQDARYKVRYLVCHTSDVSDGTPVVGRFAASFDGETLTSYRSLGEREAAKANETLLVFCLHPGADDPWFNGSCYIDTLNPLAVNEFVNTTHEAYLKHCGKYFNSVVRGFFSDEPNFNSFPGGRTLPWTENFAETFQKACHYDIRSALPELVFPIKKAVSKARLDFRRHLTDRFDAAFGKTVGDWCQKHDLVFTGHLLGEDTLSKAARNTGSPMRFYREMQMPGIDVLTEHALVFNTVKQCVSVARQLGMPRRLTECYGCTGWDFSFAGYRATVEWQYALGINFRCLHHAHYTLEGLGKRDYPASISGHSPWAKQFRAVEDYFARLGAVLTKGNEVTKLLVIHPAESAFSRIVGTAETLENQKLTDLTNFLLSHQIDFDFGDEEILAQKGESRGNTLRVGNAAYFAVLIPEMATLRATTLEMLQKFVRNGGKVFYCGDAPEYLDGETSSLPQEVYRNFASFDEKALILAVAPDLQLTENGEAVTSCLALQKEGENFSTLYLVNTGCAFPSDPMAAPLVAKRTVGHLKMQVQWRVPENFKLYQLDAETGKIYRKNFTRQRDKITFPCPLGALESALFLATQEEITAALPEKVDISAAFTPLPQTAAAVTLEEENLLVLDRLQCVADGRKIEGETYLQIDAELKKLCGVTGNIQPWCKKQETPKHTFQLEMRYRFSCETLPEKGIFLVLENPELYEIVLNGNAVAPQNCGFWCDRAIVKIALPAEFFRQGKNELHLKRRYDETTPGLESLFLLGNFGVKEDVLTAPVKRLKYGDWTKQQLPYYAGNIVYKIELPEGTKAIRFPAVGGAAVENTETGEIKMLPPFTMETCGTTTLKIRILGSRRNAFGPFYRNDRHQPMRRGAPQDFFALECEEKQLVPGGILLPPEICR